MKTLILAQNCTDYIAKVHESFRNGLKNIDDARSWGKGYEYYDEKVCNIGEIKKRIFGDEQIDLMIFDYDYFLPANENGTRFLFTGNHLELNCKSATLLQDFWNEAKQNEESYLSGIREENIDFIITMFRYPFFMWKNIKDIYDRLIWRPASIDPKIFNKWSDEKKYDVGNLNAGIFKDNSFYSERYQFHQVLLNMKDINYYYANHPGWGWFDENTDLVGKNFSKAIGKCKIFITTGNMTYKNLAPKYIEIMASGSLLLANEPLDSELTGLVDGENYVAIDKDNLEEKVRYYLAHDEERERITQNGYKLVMERYTSDAVAQYVYNQIKKKL